MLPKTPASASSFPMYTMTDDSTFTTKTVGVPLPSEENLIQQHFTEHQGQLDQECCSMHHFLKGMRGILWGALDLYFTEFLEMTGLQKVSMLV